jgi:Fe2+ transport system protein FeoA
MENWVRLSSLKPGQTAIMRRFEGGRGVGHRLASIGLLPGSPVRVLRCIGPAILESKGNRVLIGHGMVGRIWVEPVRDAPPPPLPDASAVAVTENVHG